MVPALPLCHSHWEVRKLLKYMYKILLPFRLRNVDGRLVGWFETYLHPLISHMDSNQACDDLSHPTPTHHITSIWLYIRGLELNFLLNQCIWLATFPCGLIYLWMTFLTFLTYLTYLGDRLFFKLFAKPLRSPVRANYNWIPLKGTHRPIRPIYFWSLGVNCRRRAQGHTWGLPAGFTCRIYLKWRVQGECIYLKCNLHGQFTHTTAALLQIYPTNLHLTICAIAAADMKWSLQYFKLCTLEWQL